MRWEEADQRTPESVFQRPRMSSPHMFTMLRLPSPTLKALHSLSPKFRPRLVFCHSISNPMLVSGGVHTWSSKTISRSHEHKKILCRWKALRSSVVMYLFVANIFLNYAVLMETQFGKICFSKTLYFRLIHELFSEYHRWIYYFCIFVPITSITKPSLLFLFLII